MKRMKKMDEITSIATEDTKVIDDIVVIDNTIKSNQSVDNTKEEMISDTSNKTNSSVIYKIYTSQFNEKDGDEFYTFCSPEIINDTLVIRDYFMKDVLKCSISGMNKTIGYKRLLVDNSKFALDIKFGLIINITNKEEVAEWCNKSEASAKEEMKDIELNEYRNLFPSLVQEINKMKDKIAYANKINEELKHSQNNHRSSKSDLIDF